jgi:UDP-N-acetylglucosamine/UDP-N-acetylgalactosamine diphosphorylase
MAEPPRSADVTAENNLEPTKRLLAEHGQSHLLAFWAELSPVEKRNLLAQIQELDLAQIDGWVAELVRKPTSAPIGADITPPCSYGPGPSDANQERVYAKATALGEKLISAGKVAALVVAGGQGTRLGFDGPKGDFPISPIKNKTLFELFAETIAAASEKYQTTCRWYIMTSPLNHAEILGIFDGHDYYGLDREDIFMFQQGTLPSLDFDGRILLVDKANISRSPDGHGGTLRALYQSGALEDMKKRGIEFISYFQVDNPLVKVFDPLFIGLHALDKAEMSAKALVKTGPKEKVGNFCLVDGRVTVIEYSDLPDELAEKKNADGSLVFQLGSIAIHIISTSFVERLNAEGMSLPLHRAAKKIPHVNQKGQPVKPTKPNGIKLETFIFDALPFASKSIILETIRSQEFAPVKNVRGVDSPGTARKLMVGRAADWLESAGVTVPRRPDGSPDCLIEIAPRFALDKDDIKAKLGQIPRIKPGDKIYLA